MLGDFFTKPLSGMKFRVFRRQILNLNDDILPQELTETKMVTTSSNEVAPQECVGK